MKLLVYSFDAVICYFLKQVGLFLCILHITWDLTHWKNCQ